nr:galactose-1-phosphate uridylyltransferase [Desulfonatronovibrio hydrogenovorans]
MKSRFRQNKITGEWVIFAPSRRKRPMDFVREVVEVEQPEYDPECPFCPGNEDALARVVYEVKDDRSAIWSSRAVLNKYPALTTEGESSRKTRGIYLEGGGYGSHLVILESPKHNLQLGDMNQKQIMAVLRAYHHCYSMLSDDPGIMMVMLFKNFGRSAGASLFHPHSQIVTSSVVPRFIREREREEQRYYDEMGRCVMCDILEFEFRKKERLIFDNHGFAVFVPFAAEVPFEVWVVPLRHCADFNDTQEAELVDLAEAMEWVLKVFKLRLGDPDYNFTVNSCTRYKSGEPQLHWYLRIVPRLTTRAGFEIGSGMCINPSMPELDAEFLRG